MASYWHIHQLRVRYQETDRMAVVFHSNYANWFEIGRTEWIRHAGMPYRDIEAAGLLLPVTELQLSFVKPARYDDLVAVCTRVAEFSPVRIRFESQVRLADERQPLPRSVDADSELPGELLASGGTRHVWVNQDWKPARLDKAAPRLFELLRAAGQAQD